LLKNNTSQPASPSQKDGYFNGLDALRFFAFTIVLGAHLAFPLSVKYTEGLLGYVLGWFKYGYLAVDFFFVLSAFLISWWGLNEAQKKGDFAFGKYFARRALRIWPLYFLMVLLCLIIVQGQQYAGMKVSEMPHLLYYLTFTLNFAALKNDQFLMVILWSISVEEQYYILNGLILKWLRKYFAQINLIILAASIAFRILNLHDPLTLHYHTLSVLACFAIGNLLAYAIHSGIWKTQLEKFFSSSRANWAFILLILALAFYPVIAQITILYALEKLWLPLLFSAAIAYQVYRKEGIFNLNNQKLLNYLGKISYGLYCFHGLVIAVAMNILLINGFQYPLDNSVLSLITFPIVCLLLTIVVSHFSYHLFEKPLLQLKKHFR
jgi:peptidoglycan/LPS O-acetylase OafA/YrhL